MDFQWSWWFQVQYEYTSVYRDNLWSICQCDHDYMYYYASLSLRSLWDIYERVEKRFDTFHQYLRCSIRSSQRQSISHVKINEIVANNDFFHWSNSIWMWPRTDFETMVEAGQLLIAPPCLVMEAVTRCHEHGSSRNRILKILRNSGINSMYYDDCCISAFV